MKKIVAGFLVGMVLATAGVVIAQNVHDSDNLVMRAADPFIRFVGTFKLTDLAGTTVFSVGSSNGAMSYRTSYQAVTATGTTLTASDSGKVFLASSAFTQDITLPSAATAGLTYTFIAGDATGEIRVYPASGQTFSIKASEAGASVVTSAGVGVKNTAATNIKGDLLKVVSDGGTNWWMVNQSGIWASQP